MQNVNGMEKRQYIGWGEKRRMILQVCQQGSYRSGIKVRKSSELSLGICWAIDHTILDGPFSSFLPGWLTNRLYTQQFYCAGSQTSVWFIYQFIFYLRHCLSYCYTQLWLLNLTMALKNIENILKKKRIIRSWSL